MLASAKKCDLVSPALHMLHLPLEGVPSSRLKSRTMALQVLFGVNQRLRVEDVDSPLVNIRPVKSVLMVIVTGDRGLCGGYNNFVLKKVNPDICSSTPEVLYVDGLARSVQNQCCKEHGMLCPFYTQFIYVGGNLLNIPLASQAEKRNKELVSLGVGVKIVAVGKKAQIYFKRRKDRFEIVGES